MGVYGRRFHFLVPPLPHDRYGRCVTSGAIVIGTPVELGSTEDANGQRPLTLRTTAVAPQKGKHGILVYENPFDTAPGFDPIQYAFGDFDTAPDAAPAQMVSGGYIRFRLKNVAAETVQGQKTYAAKKMVAGIGVATPTLAIDDFIGPGPGDDTNGYWQESDSAHAWAIVTHVDNSTGEVDARLLF